MTGYLLVLSREGKVLYSRKVPLAPTRYHLKNLEPETQYTITLHAHLHQDLSPETSQHFTTSECPHTHTHTPLEHSQTDGGEDRLGTIGQNRMGQ